MLKLPKLYNLHRQVSIHAHSILCLFFSRTDPMSLASSSSSSFCRAELQRALKEQAFGIQKFSITSSSAQEASALVVLLEGQNLVVKLTSQGFSVCKKALVAVLATHSFFCSGGQFQNYQNSRDHREFASFS